jgi:hypothetical protein
MQSTGGQKRRIQWKQIFHRNKREKGKNNLTLQWNECETGRTYFCQAARMKMAEKAIRPMKDRKPMQRRITTPTKPAAADSFFQHTRTTKE